MAVTGKPSGKFLRRGAFHDKHFDEVSCGFFFPPSSRLYWGGSYLTSCCFCDLCYAQNFNFRTWVVDDATQRGKTVLVQNLKPTRDLLRELLGAHTLTTGEREKVKQLAALLTAMLQFDPEKRISPHEALEHPFITENIALS